MTQSQRVEFRFKLAVFLQAISEKPGDNEVVARGMKDLEDWIARQMDNTVLETVRSAITWQKSG